MSIFAALVQSPTLSLIGIALVHFLWQGLLIGLTAYFAMWALRGQSAAARYWTAVAFLLCMAAAPFVTLTLSWPNATGPSSDLLIAQTSSTSAPFTVEAPKSDAGSQANRETFSSAFAAPSPRISWRTLVALAWLLGVAWMSCRFITASFHAIRLRFVGITPAPSEVESLARRLSKRLRVLQPWSIHASTLVVSPLVVGCLRPMILLPASTLTQLAPSQLEAILLHELAHLRRFDLWINQFQALVETLLFFHPAVWWLSRRINLEREHCCDDLAVSALGDRNVYVNTLLALADMPRPRAALTMSAQGKNLSARIARLYDIKPSARAFFLPHMTATLLMMGMILALAFSAPRGAATESRAQGKPLPRLPVLPDLASPPKRNSSPVIDRFKLPDGPPPAHRPMPPYLPLTKTFQAKTPAPGELRVIVRDRKGNLILQPELQLWYASKPTTEGPRPTGEWVDSAGTAWNTLHGSKSKIADGESNLEPPRAGKLRVSAYYWDGNVGGSCFSPAFDWKPDAEGRRIELLLNDHQRLRARFIDKQTKKPVEGLAVRIFDEKGDILHPENAGNVNFVTDAGGRVSAALPVGKFQIEVRGRKTRTYTPDVVDYEAHDQRIAFESTIAPGADKLIELEPRPLSTEEIDERWPWIVQGKATDGKGKPLAGVGIHVSTGVGTLLGGTKTRTDKDGSYVARFSQGIHTADDVQMQYAIVSAHTPWNYEANLNRHGAKFMARKAPGKEALEGFGAKLEDVLLPGKPLTIDFVMKPAEIVSGEVIDESGKPLEGYRVYLVTDPLPPASSVLDQTTTRAKGHYAFLAVPADREFRLVVAPPSGTEARWELTSDPIRFTELKGASGGDHTYELIIPVSGAAQKKKLEFKFKGFVMRLRC